MPTAIKDDRLNGPELKMDEVQEVIVRSVCQDGYAIGVEVGRRLASKTASTDSSSSAKLVSCLLEVGFKNIKQSCISNENKKISTSLTFNFYFSALNVTNVNITKAINYTKLYYE